MTFSFTQWVWQLVSCEARTTDKGQASECLCTPLTHHKPHHEGFIMSNEVWVRWIDSARGRWLFDTVSELENDAQIKDLRKAFVKQQFLGVPPAAVEVRETEDTEELEANTILTIYFTHPPGGSAADPRPGRSKETALLLTLPQPPQQPQLDVMNKLIPFVDVLPDLLREVNMTRKSRLNPWENESARTTGSKRNEKFRKKVIAYYDRATNSKKNVKCQILDELTPVKEAQDRIIAAHIWKASTRGKGLEEFGLDSNDVNSARNGLFLTKGIEDAFDKQQVCFLYNVLESRLILWVADSSIMSETILGSTQKFSDAHQKPLLCPPTRLPYRRLLSWHARLTLELRKETLQDLNYTTQYDNSPGRENAKRDRIAEAIDVMVGPGDDASV